MYNSTEEANKNDVDQTAQIVQACLLQYNNRLSHSAFSSACWLFSHLQTLFIFFFKTIFLNHYQNTNSLDPDQHNSLDPDQH